MVVLQGFNFSLFDITVRLVAQSNSRRSHLTYGICTMHPRRENHQSRVKTGRPGLSRPTSSHFETRSRSTYSLRAMATPRSEARASVVGVSAPRLQAPSVPRASVSAPLVGPDRSTARSVAATSPSILQPPEARARFASTRRV